MINNPKGSFPVAKQGVYANTATFGLMSDSLLEWRHEHDLDYLVGGSAFKIKSLGIMEELRIAIANFFNGKQEEVALIPNLSIGLNIVAEGLNSKKEKILFLKNDYPSLSWPFKSRDFSCIEIPIQNGLEESIIETIKKHSISILALSLVQWLDGFMINMDYLKRFKAQFPDLLIIADGTQYCGAYNFDFQNSGIDILACSGYKWLLAGTGNGFMLLNDAVRERCRPKESGFNASGANVSLFQQWTLNKYFEPGHLDSLAFGSLLFSIKNLATIGMGKIAEHNKCLAEYASKELLDMGFIEEAYTTLSAPSTIFNLAGDSPLFDHLERNKVVCSKRGQGIRVSFHYYNTLDDLKVVFDILKSY